jgi:hypothetical protein
MVSSTRPSIVPFIANQKGPRGPFLRTATDADGLATLGGTLP